MGLKSLISGPFFVVWLVDLGCRWTDSGRCLGTAAGTVMPTPLCACRAHVVLRLNTVKYFGWDDAKNAKRHMHALIARSPAA
jgi:hypothetical protein